MSDLGEREFRISGSIEVGAPAVQPAELPEPVAPEFSISGNLISAHYGFPLPGLRVLAYFVDPQAADAYNDCSIQDPPGDAELLLGTAAADEFGRFEIALLDTAGVQQKLSLLQQFAELSVVLHVEGEDGQVAFTSPPLNAASGAIVVTCPVSLPEVQITSAMWAELGERLEQGRVAQVHVLARDLAAFNEPLPFADWNMETRQAALNQLEQAFLDPQFLLREHAAPLPTLHDLRAPGTIETFQERLGPALEEPAVQTALTDYIGKAQSFPDLFSVDWIMDMNELREGKIEGAVNQFIDHYRREIDLKIDWERLAAGDYARYRDYLLAIWTEWITEVMYYDPHRLTPQQAIEQLRNRFHQDFLTNDTDPQPANQVLIPILSEILLAARGGAWGFGLQPENMEAQGARTPRQYLDYLIGLTGVSAHELGLRYRLDYARPDSDESSPVKENIAALQGFFRDSFQRGPEPVPAEPAIVPLPNDPLQPIIPDKLQGKAPFFLYFEEWRSQQSPFYAENYFDIRRTLAVANCPMGWLDNEIHDAEKDKIKFGKAAGGHAKYKEATARANDYRFIKTVCEVSNYLKQGHDYYYRGEYNIALEKYKEASKASIRASGHAENWSTAQEFRQRNQALVNNMGELVKFMKEDNTSVSRDVDLRKVDRWQMRLKLYYYYTYTIPVCLGDTNLALGNYAEAVSRYEGPTRFPVGMAQVTDSGGYRPGKNSEDFALYFEGDRPYTVKPQSGWNDKLESYDHPPHPLEASYFRLRQANAMLEWADALYRSSEPSTVQRARELYKGVLFLHGEIPPTGPQWTSDRPLGLTIAGFINFHENPALVAQKARARQGLYQINEGLNYYGESDDLVPPLRYHALKETAERFTTLAKASQNDFLLYMENMENGLIERMKLSNLMQKVTLQTKIAGEQIKNAQYGVTLAQEQAAKVAAQVEAKKKENADAESFFSQLGEYVEGMKNFVSGAKGAGEAVAGEETLKETAKQLKGEALLGVGWGGAAVMGAYAGFVAGSYMTMSSMADASNRRSAELRVLRDKALPRAKELVEARKREVKIAGFQAQIARADRELAHQLITFEQDRFLNFNFWSNLAQIARRLLRRYLELGTRMAWLAERALAYEQDRPIDLIRFDYYPEKLQGVTGADLLQADLAEMEALRIEGMSRLLPVRSTISLARDYPLQFGRLKRTGRCLFKTEELPFAIAHPGTTGYRLRAVSVRISQTNLTHPVRGLLINQGVSISHPGQADEHVIVRPSAALPISEFNLQKDMAVYGLPDETLLTFEGSAVETFWEIVLPAAANPSGYAGIADVLLTLDLWAQFSPDLHEVHLANMPQSVRRWVFISGEQQQPQAIKALAGADKLAAISFDIGALNPPAHETGRRVKNVVMFLAGPTPVNCSARFSATHPAADVDFTFDGGIAMSNLPATANDPAPPPLPLNVLLDFTADQTFLLTIDKAQNPGVDFSGVSDVVLGIEYEADLM